MSEGRTVDVGGGPLPFFTSVRRRPVVDERGRRARFLDASIDPVADGHPPIVRVALDLGSGPRVLPGEKILDLGDVSGTVRVRDLESAGPCDSEDGVWLGRDVLDSLVLDLENRRATRANDLVLEATPAGFTLAAADTSTRAIVRRLSRGRLAASERRKDVFDWNYVEFLRGDARSARPGAGHAMRIARLPHGEIALLSAAVPYRHAAELLTLLPDPLAADTLEVMEPGRRLQLFEELEVDRATRLLGLLAPDAAVDVVRRLVPDDARLLLEHLAPERRARLVELLRYPEGSVGGVMTNDLVVALDSWTVAEARERLREPFREPDFIYFIYVVADEASKKLTGVVTLRELLVAEPQQRLGEIANRFLVTLQPQEPATVAAHRLVDSQLLAMPVVSPDMRLVGALTIDAAVTLVAPASWRSSAPRVFS